MPHHDQPGPAWYRWLYTWGGTRPANQPFTYWARRNPLVLVLGFGALVLLVRHFLWQYKRTLLFGLASGVVGLLLGHFFW